MCSPKTRKSPTVGAASVTLPTLDTWRIGSSPKWWRRWSKRCARPIRACRTAITRSRRAGSARSGCRIGTATRRCPRFRRAPSAGTRRRRPCSAPMVRSHPRWRRSRSASSRTTGSTRRCARAKRPVPSRIRPCPRRTPTCCSTTRPGDVMTLAHELGHGVHQVLAAPNGALMAPTPLTLAETASVFGEMLTFKKLLVNADRKQRKAMLAAKVEDMINTVVRQIAFYTFERAVHSERRHGELTGERIGQIFLDVQRESLGPAIELKNGYESFWVYIGHFIHSPFYVYAYAFGDCLVNALYAVYEKAHEGFAERYLAMLAAGGTKHHAELLKPFGLDARGPSFWQGGLRVIEGMIDELEGL